MVHLWKTEAPLSWRRKVEEGKREAEERKREIRGGGSGASKPGLGRSWSLSISVTPVHIHGSMRCDSLKCKQEKRIWASAGGLWN